MTITAQRYTTKDAAAYLGCCSSNSIKQSRHTGILLGVDAPAYIKIGGWAVVYKKETLDQWLDQFTEQNNTAQSA